MTLRTNAYTANPFTFRARLNPTGAPAPAYPAATPREPPTAKPQPPPESFEDDLRRAENVTLAFVGASGVSAATATFLALAAAPVSVAPFVVAAVGLLGIAIARVARN